MPGSIPVTAKQPRHMNNGGIENVENELWRDANGKHEQCHGNYDKFFAAQKIGERGATFRQSSTEERLHRSHKNDRCHQKADDSNGRERGRHRERAFENQKLADKSVQPRQTERRKHGDTHPTAKQRCPLHQASEIVDAPQTSPLFEEAHKVEKRGRGNAVIEDLHEHAAQRCVRVDPRSNSG